VSELHPTHVLVVDDSPEVLLSTQALLTEPGRVIVTAESGEDALERIAEHEYALALLDVQLPGMNGFEVAEKIRARGETRHLPIIFVTGVNVERQHVFTGYETGAVDYLLRPIDPHALRSKVAVFCDLQVQKRRIEDYVVEIEAKNAQLQEQVDEIKRLQGLIPICCNCKKVKDDDGYWQQVEIYIMERSDAQFTHALCQPCSNALYGE
jgi:CheY-like chemotaxis protein